MFRLARPDIYVPRLIHDVQAIRRPASAGSRVAIKRLSIHIDGHALELQRKICNTP